MALYCHHFPYLHYIWFCSFLTITGFHFCYYTRTYAINIQRCYIHYIYLSVTFILSVMPVVITSLLYLIYRPASQHLGSACFLIALHMLLKWLLLYSYHLFFECSHFLIWWRLPHYQHFFYCFALEVLCYFFSVLSLLWFWFSFYYNFILLHFF